jgi:hypothetical protein
MTLKETVQNKIAVELGRPVEEIDFSALEVEVNQESEGGYYEYSTLVLEVSGVVTFGEDKTKFVYFTLPYNQVSDYVTEALSALVK